jgi:hypothetical protein
MKLITFLLSLLFGVLMVVGALVLAFSLMLSVLPGIETIGVIDIDGLQQIIKNWATEIFTAKVVDGLFPYGLGVITFGSALFFALLTWRNASAYPNFFIGATTILSAVLVLGMAIAAFIRHLSKPQSAFLMFGKMSIAFSWEIMRVLYPNFSEYELTEASRLCRFRRSV